MRPRGSVPIGYDVIDKKLVPNAQEAETVRHIYRRYLELPSVKSLMGELKAQGVVTKRHGTERGGQFFARGPLYHLLSNPIYIGKVPHRRQLHEGQHEPIIDQALWDAVQAKREATRVRTLCRWPTKRPLIICKQSSRLLAQRRGGEKTRHGRGIAKLSPSSFPLLSPT